MLKAGELYDCTLGFKPMLFCSDTSFDSSFRFEVPKCTDGVVRYVDRTCFPTKGSNSYFGPGMRLISGASYILFGRPACEKEGLGAVRARDEICRPIDSLHLYIGPGERLPSDFSRTAKRTAVQCPEFQSSFFNELSSISSNI
jgi:hypothetical protein